MQAVACARLPSAHGVAAEAPASLGGSVSVPRTGSCASLRRKSTAAAWPGPAAGGAPRCRAMGQARRGLPRGSGPELVRPGKGVPFWPPKRREVSQKDSRRRFPRPPAAAADSGEGSADVDNAGPEEGAPSAGSEAGPEVDAAAAPAATKSANKVGRPGRRRKELTKDRGLGDDFDWDSQDGVRDLAYLLNWQWADVAEIWRKSGMSGEELDGEDMQKVAEWYRECRRYWWRDGRLEGKTLDDVIEVLRRWELDSYSPVFETVMSPEMEFALESVRDAEETLVDFKWMDTLTPQGLRKADQVRQAWAGQAPGEPEDATGLGDAGSVGLPTDRDSAGPALNAADEDPETGPGSMFGEMQVLSEEELGEAMKKVGSDGGAGSPGPMPAFELVPPRDWPPVGWVVDTEELAFIHGAPNAELSRKWGSPDGDVEDDGIEPVAMGGREEERRFPRWNLFLKQYREWLAANRSRIEYEASVADPIYYPGRRRRGEDYHEELLELPAVYPEQVYFGRVTTTHLHDGLFVHIGAVHDGWVPIYNDDWFHIRDILHVGDPVLVQVLARRDPFRYRFPIELRLLHPNVDHLIWRRQKYPPHAPIFAREGDTNLDELARETGRPLLPTFKRVHFANRWERLFVDELEVPEDQMEPKTGPILVPHPYLDALGAVEQVEQHLLARARAGEAVTPLLVHQLLPTPEDATLVDLALAEADARVRDAREEYAEAPEAEGGQETGALARDEDEEEGGEWGEEGREEGAEARRRAVPLEMTRFERMREQLQAQHDQRAIEEAAALARDVVVRTELGLPLAEPGRTPDKVIQQISKQDERNNFIAFLFLAIDLKLFPNGIPDTRELRAQARSTAGLAPGAADSMAVAAASAMASATASAKPSDKKADSDSPTFIAEDY